MQQPALSLHPNSQSPSAVFPQPTPPLLRLPYLYRRRNTKILLEKFWRGRKQNSRGAILQEACFNINLNKSLVADLRADLPGTTGNTSYSHQSFSSFLYFFIVNVEGVEMGGDSVSVGGGGGTYCEMEGRNEEMGTGGGDDGIKSERNPCLFVSNGLGQMPCASRDWLFPPEAAIFLPIMPQATSSACVQDDDRTNND
ncbi:hypothetical protein RRG08_066726 [Elysia crispata]|uniref:Uncharacterized protein n=1 Tax=Elysia crispata TaxID=231223 RepID=A0AAE1B9R8_9GAST|nr:hypothetical protein RRG08_066726 [Elysia crispata]